MVVVDKTNSVLHADDLSAISWVDERMMVNSSKLGNTIAGVSSTWYCPSSTLFSFRLRKFGPNAAYPAIMSGVRRLLKSSKWDCRVDQTRLERVKRSTLDKPPIICSSDFETLEDHRHCGTRPLNPCELEKRSPGLMLTMALEGASKT